MISKLSTRRLLRRNPRGRSSRALLTIVVLVVLAPISFYIGPLIGPLISDIVYTSLVSCATGLICGGSKGGSASSAPVSPSCTSAANACGQTNSGFIVGGSCNATPPPNSSCPTPVIAASSGFYANPSTVGPGGSSTLTWNAANATACTITGNNGFSFSGGTSGSVSSGPISASVLFTLTCENGAGGPTYSSSVNVIINPTYIEI